MAQANYKITITNHDYYFTRYVAYVSATSKIQAIAKGAALAGQEKMRREYARRGGNPWPESLLDPEVKLEAVDLEEYWEHREEVVVDE